MYNASPPSGPSSGSPLLLLLLLLLLPCSCRPRLSHLEPPQVAAARLHAPRSREHVRRREAEEAVQPREATAAVVPSEDYARVVVVVEEEDEIKEN